jgi:hypothetical protein
MCVVPEARGIVAVGRNRVNGEHRATRSSRDADLSR